MKPVNQIVDKAVAIWAQRAWIKTWNQVVVNLTIGFPMLRTRTGTLRKHVQSASRFTQTGFLFAVGLSYGRAWHGEVSGTFPHWKITPVSRKRYFVPQKKKGAIMSWVDKKSGKRLFSRGHWIPAWKFDPPRPFLAQPMMGLASEYGQDLRQTLREELQNSFPNYKIAVWMI